MLVACTPGAPRPPEASEPPLTVAIAASSVPVAAKPPAKVSAVPTADLPRLVVEELCGRASSAAGDDVLFREGCAAYPDNLATVRKKLFELIVKFPNSPHVPSAYLLFGEIFFREGEAGDPTKYEIARQAYEKVLAYPVATTPAYAYAAYRCALAWRATNENEKALQRFQDAIKARPAQPVQAPLLAQAATDALITTYAVVGEPEAAKHLFRAAALPPKTVAALGEEYLRRGTPSDAVAAVESILQPGIAAETCVAVEAFASHLKEVDAAAATRILTRAGVLCPSHG